MAHSFTAQFVHVVYSTKGRRNIIPPEMEQRLIAYLGGILRKLNVDAIAIGGTSNHLHFLIAMRPTITLAEIVQKMKANSSRWLGEQGIDFEWQSGYGAFSVSPSMVSKVSAYVAAQKEHHRKQGFDEEFLALLKKSGIAFDRENVLG